MGMIHWNNHDEGPISKIVIGIFLASFGLILTVYFIISLFNSFSWVILLVGIFPVVFFFPILVFGGINEIIEGIDLLKTNRIKRSPKHDRTGKE